MKTALACLGLLLVVGTGVADDVVNESFRVDHQGTKTPALKGKRLFFDERERVLSDRVGDEPTDKTPDAMPTTTTESAVDSSGDVTARAPEPRSAHKLINIRYDARVESGSTLRLIINGMPCERIDRSRELVARISQAFACVSLNKPSLQLMLLEDGRRIRVMRESVEIGVLTVGHEL